ncbi:unnamed protein product [Brassica oleracea var. botrytis]
MIDTAAMIYMAVRVSMLATSPLEQGNMILNTSSANMEGTCICVFTD